jgi:hypothetical protein
MDLFLKIAFAGILATFIMDLWAYGQKKLFGIKSLDYCLVGRWLLSMQQGKFRHSNIVSSAQMKYECVAGWFSHYAIGVVFSFFFVGLISLFSFEIGFYQTVIFGIATVIVPFFVMQPSFGFGYAASKTPNPWQARVRSLVAHASFGVGLYLSIQLLESTSKIA